METSETHVINKEMVVNDKVKLFVSLGHLPISKPDAHYCGIYGLHFARDNLLYPFSTNWDLMLVLDWC